MGIEKLRQKAQREEAEKRAQQDAAARRRKTRWKLVSPALAAHPIFQPAITLWAAALGGLSVLALSSVTIARVTMFAGLGALGSGAQYLYASIAALIGAVIGLALAKLIRSAALRSQNKGSLAAVAGRRMRPIDPASELGSESLDAPLEDELAETAEGEVAPSDIPPGLYEPPEDTDGDSAAIDDAEGDHAEDEETQTDPSEDQAEAAEETAESPLAETSTEEEPFELEASCEVSEDDVLSLDTPLDAAGDTLELSEDDAVEDQAPEDGAPDPDTTTPETLAAIPLTARPEESPPPPRSGLEKLRQTAPKDLSLVELVERFAAALHDVQDRAPSDFTAAKGLEGHAERERALADALKALALFSEGGFAEASGEVEGAGESEARPRRFGSSFSGQAGKSAASAPLSSASSAASITETEQQLRDALAKLQNLRGAA